MLSKAVMTTRLWSTSPTRKTLLKMTVSSSSRPMLQSTSVLSPKWLTPEEAFEFGSGFDSESASAFASSFLLAKDFINEQEEASLMREIEPHLQRQVYQHDHWDDAIIGYRETERKHWNRVNAPIIERLREASFHPSLKLLAHTHLLDLEAKGEIRSALECPKDCNLRLMAVGYIKPHVDSVKFCGSTVAVLSLLSDALARFEDEKDNKRVVHAFLPRRSLYVMKGVSRFQYTHEIVANGQAEWRGEAVHRERRLSVIARCEAT